MANMPDEDEEIGFDEAEELDEADLVLLQAGDGRTLECVVLAILDHGGAAYAVLTPRGSLDDDEAGDLLVATYREDADGVAHFEPLLDESLLDELQGALAHLIDVASGSDTAEA
jgi:hypothetical protein